ncbi:MAG: HAD-IA family hydrolase [Bacteroidetes bacterium]|nr:HAD-IA family hydrolase [Bacteroidota bacterium]
MYLSHRVHLRKPDVAIYNLVLRENDLDATHTLFVDDSPQNIEGAKKTGLKTLWLQKGKKLQDLDSLYSK